MSGLLFRTTAAVLAPARAARAARTPGATVPHPLPRRRHLGQSAETTASSSVRRTRTALQPGERASVTRVITQADLRVFSALCGDDNPVHSVGLPTGSSEGAEGPARRVIVHGAFLNALVSGVIGTQLPGPGSIVVGQNLRYPRPCLVGDEVTTTVEVKEVRKIVDVAYRCVVNAESEDPKLVLEGNAKLIMAALADVEKEES